ncbi:MAG TPA: FAD-dependent oxidoreductase [Solirubrobacteraceae bacterium]|nr:FAD-dependent oxidoreductase [Solirubrobacteraceae bacterium]
MTDGPGKRVLVLGAGMAGLAAAHELVALGHDPLVLEAQNRPGGRIHTLRGFADGLYAEAGAMRIPRSHDLTLRWCERYGLQLRPFVMGNPQGLVHVGGQRMTSAEADADPDRLGFSVAEHERGRTCTDLWEAAIAPERELLEREGPAAWEQIVARYDQLSLRDFLMEKGFSEGAIEMYGVMTFVESDLHNAVVEVLREDLGGAYVDMQEIVGGSDLLPRAMAGELSDRIRYGAEVHAIEQDDDSVTVHFKTEAGRFSETAGHAICTIPFSVLRTVEAITPFSREKQKAIRQLNYAASTKILFQVRERIWERDGIAGGATCTDLAIRRMNYPTPDPSTPRGVLLASYTWSQDAARWGAMDEETRLEQALEDVSCIHPGIREVYEAGDSYAWYDDPYAGGAFALFDPGQQTELQAAITQPEGRVRFAGEHCSLFHAWIQGALESGVREARAVAA